jgi:hypothetical protein
VDLKINFAKNQELILLELKGQTHPGSSEIHMSLRKIQKITLKVYAMYRLLNRRKNQHQS